MQREILGNKTDKKMDGRGRGEDVESKTIPIRHQWDGDGRERQRHDAASLLSLLHAEPPLKQFRAAKKKKG